MEGAVQAPGYILPVAIVVLFSGFAIHFAGTAAAPALVAEWGISGAEAAAFTWAAQVGFIVGTLGVTLLDLPDRFRPSRLIAAMLVLGGLAGAALVVIPQNVPLALTLRLLVGVLAGPVYPIGMKLLATWYPRLGWELGLLLGASTFGAGAAFGFRAAALPWQGAMLATSAIAVAAAVASLALLRTGPLLPTRTHFDVAAGFKAFRERDYRRSALGYFGHMWELFAVWGLLPLWLAATGHGDALATALTAGAFATGAVATIAGGAWSRRIGEARVAGVALAASGALCLASPLLFGAPLYVLVPAVLLWGAVVIADSPMYSAISAVTAPKAYVGSALTIQNSVGYAITVVSIALVPAFVELVGSWQYGLLLLAPGPLLGLVPVWALVRDGWGDDPKVNGPRVSRRVGAR